MNLQQQIELCKIQNWYPRLAVHTFPTVFVMLNEEEISALANGETTGEVVQNVLPRLTTAMSAFLYTRFVSTDFVAPTDSERFRTKRGAVRSAASAWNTLADSEKVRNAAKEGNVSCIAVRPFRRMDVTREFRLFIKDGQLKSMSQYWLIRHYRRLAGVTQKYWELADNFVKKIAWCLPCQDIVMDIYFTSADEILVLDLNPWGPPTAPLMLMKWDIDWDSVSGCKIVPPPLMLGGDVEVSF